MKTLVAAIKEIRAGNFVKRSHTDRVLMEETVGHHSANVALLCYLLAPELWSANLALAALGHDLKEQYTGDIPAPAKWMSLSLCKALKHLEGKYFIFPKSATDLTTREAALLKQADGFDYALRCVEELEMGNKVMLPNLGRILGSMNVEELNDAGKTLFEALCSENTYYLGGKS